MKNTKEKLPLYHAIGTYKEQTLSNVICHLIVSGVEFVIISIFSKIFNLTLCANNPVPPVFRSPYKNKQKQYVKLNYYRKFPRLREFFSQNVICISLVTPALECMRQKNSATSCAEMLQFQI